MKSKFEEYLQSYRSKMDVEDPDDQLIWDGISKALEGRKTAWHKHFWKAAAAVILLASLTYVFYNEFYRPPQNIYNITLSDIEPEYSDEVNAYRATFNRKWEQVNRMNTGDIQRLDAFMKELDGLDTMYRHYQEDYHTYGYNEQLIRAMLDYYDKRVRILDRMLMEIQKHKDYEKRKQEHTEI